jgi:hypothetical protein
MFKTNSVLQHEGTGHDVGFRVADAVWVCFDCGWTELSQLALYRQAVN